MHQLFRLFFILFVVLVRGVLLYLSMFSDFKPNQYTSKNKINYGIQKKMKSSQEIESEDKLPRVCPGDMQC